MPTPEAAVYQLKVTLRGIRPPIWRRLLVPAAFHLGKLHVVLQLAMGWEDEHLHQFLFGEKSYGVPDEDDELYGVKTWDETRFRLGKIAPAEKSQFVYEYDFGDGWYHDIVVEKVLPREPGARYPVCVAGKRACPPEDCGGRWGYGRFLEALSDPMHEDHRMYMEWTSGEGFDPQAFDRESTNNRLARVRW